MNPPSPEKAKKNLNDMNDIIKAIHSAGVIKSAELDIEVSKVLLWLNGGTVSVLLTIISINSNDQNLGNIFNNAIIFLILGSCFAALNVCIQPSSFRNRLNIYINLFLSSMNAENSSSFIDDCNECNSQNYTFTVIHKFFMIISISSFLSAVLVFIFSIDLFHGFLTLAGFVVFFYIMSSSKILQYISRIPKYFSALR